jgi:ABC-2 type transport system permease protein
VTDGIAGERERHTLETLLATRLCDRAILFGKIGAAVAYGLLQAWLIALVSFIAVNAAFWTGRIVFYSPGIFLAIIIFPVLMAILSASAAALVSMRAETARQAQQTMSISFIIIFIPVILINFLSQRAKESIGSLLARINWEAVPYYIGISLVLADVILLFIADRKFKRQRLVLE